MRFGLKVSAQHFILQIPFIMITTEKPKKKIDPEEGKRIHLSEDRGDILDIAIDDIRHREKERLTEQQARNTGFPYVNLKQFPLSNNALLVVERDFCEHERVVCFLLQAEHIRLGTTDPLNPKIREKAKELEEAHRAEVSIYLISEDSLAFAFKRYDAIPKASEAHDEGIELSEETIKKQQEKFTSIQSLSQAIQHAPITEVLALIMGAAIKAGASDIHIEAEAEDIKIRLRIDGVLHDIGILPLEAWGRIISRIKLLAALKINIFNKPQDGRFTIYIGQDKVEVRASTVPTSYGESIVMRLLRFSLEALQFENLGLSGYTFDILQKEIKKPNGMIISTGPTGSGKTTTLYAVLHKLNDSETKILTLEDPVEYKIKGINQTQVNAGAGLDFAKGLRSLLRQDPDIIMVGEIRDLETADTAINAALTGHLMLSTLHTNSAAGAIPRLLAMGAKNFLLAPAINALIGQRLVRRLCEHCKQVESLGEDLLSQVAGELDKLEGRHDLGTSVDISNLNAIQFYSAPGCEQCSGLGYKGRAGIFEILTMNKDLEKIILSGTVSEYEIQEIAQKNGMITMLQDGILKAAGGITSLSEVFRVAE